MKTIASEEYFGIDASNEISLFEYGLLCQYQGLDDYYFIYGVSYDESGNSIQFDHCTLNIKDLQSIIFKDGWFEIEEFNSFADYELEHPNDLDNLVHYEIINLVHSMVSYYGYANIFGSSYDYSFEVEIIEREAGIVYTSEGSKEIEY